MGIIAMYVLITDHIERKRRKKKKEGLDEKK
jgi:hypothetical protein